MGYTIFISHSSKDIELVEYISSYLRYYEITPLIAQKVHPEEYPQYLPEKVKRLIQESDCVVSLLTKNAINSNWVQQEIGYTLDKRPLITLVESDIPQSELGFLQGTEYIPIYWEDLDRSISTLLSWTAQLKVEKEKKVLVALGIVIIGLLALWWLSKKE